MNRDEMVARLRERDEPWDIIVIGGGATGAGVAVDAAARGFATLLLEREDFGKATSSRSTKLVHGGVRYLQQGNFPLVMEALKERGLLLQNAPHLVHDLPFIIPNYSWWETPFYGIGLKIYDMLAGKHGFASSKPLSREETLAHIPTLRTEGLRGGVMYHDGQFDDSRLLIHLIATSADHGAIAVNYIAVTDLVRDSSGFISGVVAEDGESGEQFTPRARVVVNATGIFSDEIRRLSNPSAKAMVVPSQGVHLVFNRSFLRGETAVMVPHTRDGRVLFAIPWHEHTIMGTTDTPIQSSSYEPLPSEKEIDFILETAQKYFDHPPRREDVLSVYAGIRPLVNSRRAQVGNTSSLSRDHTVHIDSSGLLTIAGGKWTTYRSMAEDTLNHAIALGRLPSRKCVTRGLRIHGYLQGCDPADSLSIYGSDADALRALAGQSPALAHKLHPDLPYIAAEVVWAARHEMARTVEDVLARRTRALFLNPRAAVEMAPPVAHLLASELGRNQTWVRTQTETFITLASRYTLDGFKSRTADS